jgi:hypothetical protein
MRQSAAHIVLCPIVGLFVNNELETMRTEAVSDESEVLSRNLPGVGSGIQRNASQETWEAGRYSNLDPLE